MNGVAVTAVVEAAEFRQEILRLPVSGMVFEALVIHGLGASDLVNADDQRAEILKGSDGPEVQDDQTESGKAEQCDRDLQIGIGDNRITVLLQVELLSLVEFSVFHRRKYSTMAPELSPDMPLKT